MGECELHDEPKPATKLARALEGVLGRLHGSKGPQTSAGGDQEI